MAKPKHRRSSKTKAINNVLGRLGFHASASDVVAALAQHGIHVSEGLVQKVKVEILKDTSAIRRQLAALQRAGQNSTLPWKRKVPARRPQPRQTNGH